MTFVAKDPLLIWDEPLPLRKAKSMVPGRDTLDSEPQSQGPVFGFPLSSFHLGCVMCFL